MPIYYATGSRAKALMWCFFSGITEPIGGILGFAALQQHLVGRSVADEAQPGVPAARVLLLCVVGLALPDEAVLESTRFQQGAETMEQPVPD